MYEESRNMVHMNYLQGINRAIDKENRRVDMEGQVGQDKLRDWD